jgi:hypothetical protein
MRVLGSDKKKRGGNVIFIVPDKQSAVPVSVPLETINAVVNGVFL